LRLIVAFIFIFVWISACAPAKKHQKKYVKPDYSEPYSKKSPKVPIRGNKKESHTPKGLSPFMSKSSLAPTILNEKDQTLMILIDRGKYLFGEKEMATRKAHPNAQNSQFVTLSAFYIDRTETTVANFKKFQPRYNEKPYADGKPCPQCPAMGIEWIQAYKYCKWAGKRLPNELEWEAAARGSSTFTWPWGNDYLPQNANTFGKEDGHLFAAPVASFPMGASPFGVMDMSGNVWEWVKTEGKSSHIVKGGGWTSDKNQSKISFRNSVDAKLKNPTFGFRCARS